MDRVSAKRTFAAATVLYGWDYPFSETTFFLPNIVKKHKKNYMAEYCEFLLPDF